MNRLVELIVFISIALILSRCSADLITPDVCGLEYSDGELRNKVRCSWRIPQPSEWNLE